MGGPLTPPPKNALGLLLKRAPRMVLARSLTAFGGLILFEMHTGTIQFLANMVGMYNCIIESEGNFNRISVWGLS